MHAVYRKEIGKYHHIQSTQINQGLGLWDEGGWGGGQRGSLPISERTDQFLLHPSNFILQEKLFPLNLSYVEMFFSIWQDITTSSLELL